MVKQRRKGNWKNQLQPKQNTRMTYIVVCIRKTRKYDWMANNFYHALFVWKQNKKIKLIFQNGNCVKNYLSLFPRFFFYPTNSSKSKKKFMAIGKSWFNFYLFFVARLVGCQIMQAQLNYKKWKVARRRIWGHLRSWFVTSVVTHRAFWLK